MKRVITTFLTVLMVFSMACPIVLAATDQSEIQPCYERFASCHVGLDIGKNGKASCFGHAFAYEETDTVNVMVTLQKQNGNSWEHVRNWSASGKQFATVDKAYYVVPGTYRVYLSISAYNANGGFEESTTLVSKTVTYK